MNLLTASTLLFLTAAPAQAPAPAPAPAPGQAVAPSDRAVNPSQPDFTLVALPTTLRIPRFGSAFRVTHRFSRSLGQGDLGDLVSDFFGFDSGAQIGLEYRFGIMAGTQLGFHRTSDRTIQLFLQHSVLRQRGRMPVGVDALASAEGGNNLRERRSPSLGAVISRTLGRHGAVYISPIWVNNSNPLPSALVDDNDTVLLGLGTRVRVRPSVYVVAEATPSFGYRPGVAQASFGLEKRTGGHSFQINVSNGTGTTPGQLTRSGVSSDSWYIGFNISRKFF